MGSPGEVTSNHMVGPMPSCIVAWIVCSTQRRCCVYSVFASPWHRSSVAIVASSVVCLVSPRERHVGPSGPTRTVVLAKA
jgi:hypothetical protein